MSMDREIAEKVFGFEYVIHTEDGYRKDYYKEPNGSKRSLIECHFSTEINYAMEVEAEMFRRFGAVTFMHTRSGWMVVIYGHNSAVAESLPEAICKAALAVREQYTDEQWLAMAA